MKKLQESGHSIGLHTINHVNAIAKKQIYTPESYFNEQVKPQLDICRKNGINAVAFAFPNNIHNDEFDKYFFQHFDFLRAGVGTAKKLIFVPVKNLKRKMVLRGTGIGVYYKSDINNLKKLLDYAADNDAMIAFFSHDIYPSQTCTHAC